MISVRFEGLDEYMALLQPDIYRNALRSTLNQLGARGKTLATTKIREEYNVKLADLNKKMRVIPATNANMRAIIQAEGRPIPLLYFNAKQMTAQNRMITRTTGRQMKRAGRLGQGVTVQIRKGESVNLPHAFIATMGSGHMGVFMRAGKSRLKIREKAFVTVPTVFVGKATLPTVTRGIMDQYPQVMAQNINYYQGRARR